jgi:hypothetical protein
VLGDLHGRGGVGVVETASRQHVGEGTNGPVGTA